MTKKILITTRLKKSNFQESLIQSCVVLILRMVINVYLEGNVFNSHSIGDIREPCQPLVSNSRRNVRLFKNLSFWVTNIVLSFLRNEEILGLRTVNNEAKTWWQRAYSARSVEISKISLKTAQFFKRAITLEINHESEKFFKSYKDSFFEDILEHYSNLKTIKIDLNEVFDQAKKDYIIDKITCFPLNIHIEEVCAIRSMIKSRDLESLTSTNFLENINRLSLSMNAIENEDLVPLVSARVLRNLKELDLSSNQLTDEGVEFLVSTEIFENLRSLNLSFNKIENKGLRILAQAATFPNLICLELSNTKIDKKGIADLAMSKNYQDLEKLVLNNNAISVDGAKELSSAGYLKNLKTLSLKQWNLGDEGWTNLMKSHSLLKNILTLDLGDNDISHFGAEIIAKNAHLQNLSRLVIPRNNIQDSGLIQLASSNFIKSIEILDISNNEISAEGVLALTESEVFKNIKKLYISENKLKTEGAKQLTDSVNFNHLQVLDLRFNTIGTEGGRWIAESESFPMLYMLSIFHGNDIDEHTKKSIQKSKNLKNLIHLN